MTAFNEVSARIVKFLLGLRPGSVRESGRSYDFLLQQINRRRAQLHEIDGTQLQAIIHELRCQAWNDSLLVEVFALAADQTERILGLRLFDVQLLGALVMSEGKVAEMQTGEGKTLAAVPAICPLTLAGGDMTPPEMAHRCATIARRLRLNTDYGIDEYARNVHLLDAGAAKVETALRCGNLSISATCSRLPPFSMRCTRKRCFGATSTT